MDNGLPLCSLTERSETRSTERRVVMPRFKVERLEATYA